MAADVVPFGTCSAYRKEMEDSDLHRLEAELDNIQEENDLVLLAAEVEKDLRKIVEKEVGHSGPESSRKRLRGVTEYSYNLVGHVYGDPRPTTRRCKVNSITGNIAISEQGSYLFQYIL